MKTKQDRLTWLAVLFFSFGCALELYGHGGQIETGEGGGGPVTLSKVQQDSIGIKTAKADLRSIDTILAVNGAVQLDPNLHAHVTTRISGRVDQLLASVGDRVEKGQKLALIQSRQIGDPPPEVEVDSPMSGVINERSVTVGDAVEPDKELFHVVDLSKVIVVAQVYEEDTGKVKLGQKARVHAFSFPKQEFAGEVTFLGLELNSETRTLPVWIAVDNPEGKLRGGMFARASLLLATSADVLAVPNESILEEGGEKFVFVQTGNTFTRADVQTGAADDRFIEIKDGLVPDDAVVIAGQRELYTQWLTGSPKPGAGEDKSDTQK